MFAERSLSWVNQAFRDGSLADSVVLALAKLSAGRPLNPDDRRALEQATAFLSQARDGFLWAKEPTVSSESRACASLLERVVQTSGSAPTSSNLLADIESMLATLRAILADPPAVTPDQAALQQVRAFFGRVLKGSVTQLHELLSPFEAPRKAEWMFAGKSKT